MPELPEVEAAVRQLRVAGEGRRIVRVRMLHPSLRARLPAARARAIVGARIARIDRRGKHQLLHLDDGRVVHAHFRMAGDWLIDRASGPTPRFARAVLELDDGSRIWLVDPRALSSIEIREAGSDTALALGPEATDRGIRPRVLLQALRRRRGPIKPALLDQKLIAGVGNIYAVEALWQARLDPRSAAAALSERDVSRLLSAVRSVLRRALTSDMRFAVYDRAGQPCRRCRAPIQRIVQAGRSTYFCAICQLPAGAVTSSRSPRAAHP